MYLMGYAWSGSGPSAEDARTGTPDIWYGPLGCHGPRRVDVYTVDPEFEWAQDEPWSRWQLDHGETFYQDPSSAEALPMPVYFQSLRWLNRSHQRPGGWQILSLGPQRRSAATPRTRWTASPSRPRDWDPRGRSSPPICSSPMS